MKYRPYCIYDIKVSTQSQKIVWSIQEILSVEFNLAGMINLTCLSNMKSTKNNMKGIGTLLIKLKKIILKEPKEYIIHFVHFSGSYSSHHLIV